MGVDLATLEAVFLVGMGGGLIVLGGAFLLGRRTVDRVSAVLLALAGVYAILWQQPALLGVGEALHVAVAQPVFLLLLSGAVFLWTYWLFERHAERLEEAHADLAEALSLERTLVDVLSHDLRNPISAAQLDIQALKRKRPSLAEELAPIEEEIERAADVMTDGLVFSRLSTPTGDLPTELLDLADVVATAVDSGRERAAERDVTIELDGPEHLPIQGSPLLQQAIENLVDNAVKFSPRAGKIEVELEGGADAARITVLDEGPGMPTDDRGELFQRFQQGDDGPLGAGLGLAIVQRLVDLHDGDVEIRGEAEDGTRIEIRLPRDAESPDRPPSTADRPSVGDHLQEVIG